MAHAETCDFDSYTINPRWSAESWLASSYTLILSRRYTRYFLIFAAATDSGLKQTPLSCATDTTVIFNANKTSTVPGKISFTKCGHLFFLNNFSRSFGKLLSLWALLQGVSWNSSRWQVGRAELVSPGIQARTVKLQGWQGSCYFKTKPNKCQMPCLYLFVEERTLKELKVVLSKYCCQCSPGGLLQIP